MAILRRPFTKSAVIEVMGRFSTIYLAAAIFTVAGFALLPVLVRAATTLSECNVVWTLPSADSFGSMPLGNGDVGANVWVEPKGDLLFYVSKVDAYDSAHQLKKLGRIRVRFTPLLATHDFMQRSGCGKARFRFARATSIFVSGWMPMRR